MLLWKKYNDKKEETYKLDKIGLKYINLGKIEYNGNLDTYLKKTLINSLNTILEMLKL